MRPRASPTTFYKSGVMEGGTVANPEAYSLADETDDRIRKASCMLPRPVSVPHGVVFHFCTVSRVFGNLHLIIG